MLICYQSDSLSVKSKNAADLADVARRKAWITIKNVRILYGKENNPATGIIIVFVCLKYEFIRFSGNHPLMKIIVPTILDGVRVWFSLMHGNEISNQLAANHEEDADHWL